MGMARINAVELSTANIPTKPYPLPIKAHIAKAKNVAIIAPGLSISDPSLTVFNPRSSELLSMKLSFSETNILNFAEPTRA